MLMCYLWSACRQFFENLEKQIADIALQNMAVPYFSFMAIKPELPDSVRTAGHAPCVCFAMAIVIFICSLAQCTFLASHIFNIPRNNPDNLFKNVQNNVSAEAEGANASVTVNGEEKSCTADAGDSCKVEINNSDNNSNTASSANTTENANVMPKTDTEKNIVQTVASAVSNFAKSVTDKIISWFS